MELADTRHHCLSINDSRIVLLGSIHQRRHSDDCNRHHIAIHQYLLLGQQMAPDSIITPNKQRRPTRRYRHQDTNRRVRGGPFAPRTSLASCTPAPTPVDTNSTTASSDGCWSSVPASIIFFSNCGWVMQGAIGVAYIILNMMYWVIPFVMGDGKTWDLSLYHPEYDREE